MAQSIYDVEVESIEGKRYPLAEYRGKVVLVVNTASKCGFTPQYQGLEALYRKYRDRGLVILGFPCDQFGHQEPGNEAEIAEFCSLNYDVTFPMHSKIEVNGSARHPLYDLLTRQKSGVLGTRSIKWNFTKFLVGRDGHVLERFGSTTTPEKLEASIEAALAAPA